jgi:hypothetical protein
MTNAISEEKIRNIVKNEIENALGEFLIRMKLEILPYVSREEQKEIENLYGKDLAKNDEEDIAVSRKLRLSVKREVNIDVL